jgi:hypothetical protein
LACGDDGGTTPALDQPDAMTETTSPATQGGETSAMGMTRENTVSSMSKDGGPLNLDADVIDTAWLQDSGASADVGDAMPVERFDPQLPPTDAEAVQRWLAKGYYMDWVCEGEPNAKTDGAGAIHVHGAKTRVCANVLLAASRAPGTSGEFPAGVAAVKEVYDAEDTVIATVVSVKAEATSAGGDNWFWYESPSAQGFGFAGCTGCHSAAGADDDHPGAGDFVYFQTKDEAQLPPVGDVAELETWLAAGYYLNWKCEDEPSVKTDGAAAIHVHPKNRICVNDRLASGAGSNGEWPAGVAAVKELYGDTADGGVMTSAVLYSKINSASGEGDGWFWFAGEGSTGFGIPGCTGCHSAAGSDNDHPGAGDFVYNRVE